MKKVLLAAGALSALAIALPAAAQPYQGGRDSIHQRFSNIEQRLERGIDRGQINRREAVGLRQEFRALVRLDSQYRRDGLSRWEHQDLMRRADGLSARIRYERRDDDRRYGDNRWDDHRRDGRRGY